MFFTGDRRGVSNVFFPEGEETVPTFRFLRLLIFGVKPYKSCMQSVHNSSQLVHLSGPPRLCLLFPDFGLFVFFGGRGVSSLPCFRLSDGNVVTGVGTHPGQHCTRAVLILTAGGALQFNLGAICPHCPQLRLIDD